MKNTLENKGQKLKLTTLAFTLIELLAVIVILAIIALIAVPIIVNIIRDTKEKSTLISAQNYIDAIELAIANKYLNEPNFNLDGIYTISKDGKTITSENKTIKIEYEGNLELKFEEEASVVEIENGKVIDVSNLKIRNGYLKIELGKVVILDKMPTNTLIRGERFNSKIKTLAGNSEATVWSVDKEIKSIEFLSNGKLPEGYTLNRLKQLNNVDVSENQDESIIAYYDNGKIFIHSYDLIMFNNVLYGLFSSLRELINIEFGKIDTSNVENMSYVFFDCRKLSSLDLSVFNTSKVTSMHALFEYCYELEKLDLSNFDTSNVEKMSYMFAECSKLKELDLSNFDTSKVEDMQSMFAQCYKLEKINMNNFDTSSLRVMLKMFYCCYDLQMLDLRSFDTSQVTNMKSVFQGTQNLKPIYVGEKWIINEGTDITDMFGFSSKTTNLEELCEPGSTEEWCVVTG